MGDDAPDPRPPLDYATPAPRRRARWPWWVIVGLVAALTAAFLGVGF